MLPILVGVFVVLCFLYGRRIYEWAKERKHLSDLGDQIAGKRALPLIGNAHQLPTNAYDHIKMMIEESNIHIEQGERIWRVWIGTTLYVVPLDGETVKDILDQSVELSKGSIYDFLVPWLGTGLLISTDDKWRSRRKMLTPTFHFAMLESYFETFNSESEKLTKHLEPYANGETVDLFPFIKRCALDIICETAMGTTVNAQGNHNHPYVRAVREMSHLLYIISTRPWFMFEPLLYVSGYGRTRDDAVKTLTDFTKNVIAERKETRQQKKKSTSSNSERKAFLDMLLDLSEGQKLSDEDIREEVDTFMFEGHDTTSSGIGFTLWCLACHSEIQDRVAAELFNVFGDSDRPITSNDLKSLTYLEMCLKESLRICPPVPMVNRLISHGDLKIGNKIVPKGAVCSIAPVVIHHNEKLYPNAHKFDPDNFLPENVAKRHAYDFVPFSAGPRNCIGQKFAMNEEKTMVAWVLRRYRLEATLPFEDNPMGIEVTLIPKHGFPIHLHRRTF